MIRGHSRDREEEFILMFTYQEVVGVCKRYGMKHVYVATDDLEFANSLPELVREGGMEGEYLAAVRCFDYTPLPSPM